MLPGILVDRMQSRKMLCRRLVDFKVLQLGEAVRNGGQRCVRFGQNTEQILAGNRTICRVNQFPPALYRFLHLTLGFGVFDQTINQTVNFAFYRLIRN